jgi:hypothetical protein
MEPDGSLPHLQELSTCPSFTSPIPSLQDRLSTHGYILVFLEFSSFSRVPINTLHAYLSATWSAYLILLNLFILIILGFEYKLWRCLLHNFLHLPVTSSLFRQNILDQSRYFSFQVAPQLYSRGWVDAVPDPLLLRKSGSAGNRTRNLWICSQELWPQDHRGGNFFLNNI